jgi:hypothetical protein
MNHHGALRLAPCDRLAQRRVVQRALEPLTRAIVMDVRE